MVLTADARGRHCQPPSIMTVISVSKLVNDPDPDVAFEARRSMSASWATDGKLSR